MKQSVEPVSQSVELTNRYNTGLVAGMVETAMTNGAQLRMTSEQMGAHFSLDNNPLAMYRALATSKGVTVGGTYMELPEKGVGISLTMTMPGASSTESATYFTLTVGLDEIRLPTNGQFLNKEVLGDLFAATNAGHRHDEILESIQLVAGTIGIAPLSVFDAANNFLAHNQDYIAPAK